MTKSHFFNLLDSCKKERIEYSLIGSTFSLYNGKIHYYPLSYPKGKIILYSKIPFEWKGKKYPKAIILYETPILGRDTAKEIKARFWAHKVKYRRWELEHKYKNEFKARD